MKYKDFTLENIKGMSVTKKGNRAFHCRISIDTHTTGKNAHTEAVGLLYVQMLLSGCEGYTRQEFLDAINLLGASIQVTMHNGILTVTCTSLDTHRDKLMKLVTCMLQKPTFAPQELTRCKEFLENEIHEEKEDAKGVSFSQFVDALYNEIDRRYQALPDALLQENTKVTKKEIEKTHKAAMQQHWVVTIVDDETSVPATIQKLQKLRASFGEPQNQEAPHATKKLRGTSVQLASIPSKQNIELNIGAVLPVSITQKEFHAFAFGLDVLGRWGGFAGRLMSTVREKEGLTYGIYAKTETSGITEHGYWRIMTFFAPNKVMQGITSVFRELENIHEKGITKIEYERFLTILNTDEVMLQDSLLKTAAQMHAYQMKGFSLHDIEVFKKQITAVTREEVNQALKKLLDPQTLVISCAGPTLAKSKELKALGRLVNKAK